MKKKTFLLLATGTLLLPGLLSAFPLKHKIKKKIDYENLKQYLTNKLNFNINILEKKLDILKEEKKCISSANNLKVLNVCLQSARKKDKELKKIMFEKFKKLQLARYNTFIKIIKQEIEKIKNTNNKKLEKKLIKLEKAYKYLTAVKEALEKSNTFKEFRRNKKIALIKAIYDKNNNKKVIKKSDTAK